MAYGHPQQGKGESALRLRRDFGRYLKQWREDAGLTQAQLAKILGYEYYTFISQIESGKGRVPPEGYEAWADALRVDRKEFTRTLLKFYDPNAYRILFAAA